MRFVLFALLLLVGADLYAQGRRILVVDEAKIRQSLELAGHSVGAIDTLLGIGSDDMSVPTSKAVVDYVADLGGLDTAYVVGDSLFLVQGVDTTRIKLSSPVAGRNVEISGDTINASTDVGRRLFVDKANYTGTPVPGDPAQPFRDPWQAIDSFEVGDIIEVLAGTYVAVDSARMGTYPDYDVIVTLEDRYRHNFMSKNETYFLFRPGTEIQWSATEAFLAYDTLGYSMKLLGDVKITMTETSSTLISLNDNDNTSQPSNLEIEVDQLISSGSPAPSRTVLYLANGNNVKVDIDQVEGSPKLVYYDGLYGVNNTDIRVGRWLMDYGYYNIQLGGDTLRNQNHRLRIDYLNIADFDLQLIEINRTYYWDNTNFQVSFGQLVADRVNKAAGNGGGDSEGLVYGLVAGAFWDNAVHLQNSNLIFDCENYYGNVPLLQMIYAPNATETDNFNFEFRGNYVYHTDYIGSTGTQGIFGPRSWTPPPGFQVTLNGTFVTQDTVNLISTRIGDVRLQGLFKTAGSEPVLNIETESNGTVELLNAHLINDGTAPEVTAEDEKTVFLRTRWEPSNLDTNVVFERYPLHVLNPYGGKNTAQASIDSLVSRSNGVFSSSNDNGNIPAGMEVNTIDSLKIKKSNFGDYRPSLVLEHSTGFFGAAGGIALHYDVANESVFDYLIEPFSLYAGGTRVFDISYAGNVGIAWRAKDTLSMIVASANGPVILEGESYVSLGANTGSTKTDSLIIPYTAIPYDPAVDSVLAITPSGKIAKVALNDVGGGITLDTVLVQSDTLIDWNSTNFKVIQLDMTSVTAMTLEFANPTDPLFGTIQFIEVSGTDSVTFPANVYWMDETSVGTLNITQSGKYTLIYDGSDYWME